VPDDANYVQPTFSADRDRLHLEARYSYEDRKTGSAWIGYNISLGDEVTFELTPMIGGVFGRTAGIAPGYKASLSYKKLAFSTEGEYVIDFGESSDSFFYTWSELSFSPIDHFRAGIAIQRDEGLPDQLRHPARVPRRRVLQARGLHDVCVQSGRRAHRRPRAGGPVLGGLTGH
jgi:hypothetical protein